MLYLVDGQPKSGSTFLFQLVTRLIEPDVNAEALQAMSSRHPFRRRADEDSVLPFIYRPTEFELELAENRAWQARLRSGDAVLKLHHGVWLIEDAASDFTVHFYTYRNVLDVAMALWDQGKREPERPPSRQRPAFLQLGTPGLALKAAIGHARERTLPALADSRIVSLPYPSFIQGDESACARIAARCGVDIDRVRTAMRELDIDIRAGRTEAQFGTGVTGRGATARWQFPESLVAEAERLNHEMGF